MGNQPNETSKVGQAQLPSRESVTEHQILMLMHMMNGLNPFLLGSPLNPEFSPPQKIDGGVACAASVSFINLCSRLDAILADNSRWDTLLHDRLYASIEKVQTAQVKFLEEQAASAAAVRRPCFQMRPTIAQSSEDFIAVFGDLSKPGCYIIGRGKTANEALLDFDKAFDRTTAEQLLMVATDQGITFEQPKTEPKQPRKKKSNE
jgi:hypothetical protein